MSLPPPQRLKRHAPILLLPNVLDRDLRQTLMAQFDRELPIHASVGRATAGFGLEKGDFFIEHENGYGNLLQLVLRSRELTDRLDAAWQRKIVPAIEHIFQTKTPSREHWLVSRYQAPGQFLSAHRDRGTPATQHRNYTLTINLNGGEYEGGELRFPEFGGDLYDPDPGTAVIWSANMMHEVLPVTRGTRFIVGAHLSGMPQAARMKVDPMAG